MRVPHLFRVRAGPEAFSAVFAAARQAGQRLGWLELAAPQDAGPSLEAAAALGALRAVAVGEGRSVAVKLMAGRPVLRDVLREHFLGCTAVLVAGEGALAQAAALEAAPRLESAQDGWRLTPGAGGAPQSLTTGDLLACFRSPRPVGRPAPPAGGSGPGSRR
jgi:hypothetical protein